MTGQDAAQRAEELAVTCDHTWGVVRGKGACAACIVRFVDAAVAEARMREFHTHDGLREVNKVLVAQLAEAVKERDAEIAALKIVLHESGRARADADLRANEARREERELWNRTKPIDAPPVCSGCGGPHPFDTSVPSVVWNRVIRDGGLPDYLCTTCIVRAFALVGESFTATLWSPEFDGLPIHVMVRDQVAADATAISDENTRLRAELYALRYPPASAPASHKSSCQTLTQKYGACTCASAPEGTK